MSPLIFKPILKRIRWGGNRLGTMLEKPIGRGMDWAESWEIADHGADQSVVADGAFQGWSLSRLVQEQGRALLGKHSQLRQFPLLIKYLDAHDRLSVQVHPNDVQAQQYDPGENGKTEAWVIIDAQPESCLYVGLKDGVDRPTLEQSLAEGTVERCLHRITVERGDCVFIPAGTVHAIGEGVLLAEVQQSSDLTFRLYDWGRLGSDGKPRRLHVEDALACIDFERGPVTPETPQTVANIPGSSGIAANTQSDGFCRLEQLVQSSHFAIRRHTADTRFALPEDGRFHVLMTFDGKADLQCGPDRCEVQTGATWLIPADRPNLDVLPHNQVVLLDAYLV